MIIPQVGMVQSLNISVACAVSVFEASRQRRVAGMYDSPQLDVEGYDIMVREWLQR
jgi:tRNA (guanosine-2'-O-)-methyltransferase